jgi:phenylalanine-4-hydroxylase
MRVEHRTTKRAHTDLTTGGSDYVAECEALGLHYAPQPYRLYSVRNHDAWREVHGLISAAWQGRACTQHLEGVAQLSISAQKVPRLAEINAALYRYNGIRATPVVGLLPALEFFDALLEGRFPSTISVRGLEHIEFTPAPDLAHDALGHFGLLLDPAFTRYLRLLGFAAQQIVHTASNSATPQLRELRLLSGFQALARLTWFTVEVGLIREAAGVRAYGGALLSSRADLIQALEGNGVEQCPFTLSGVVEQAYDYTALQRILFVTSGFAELHSAALELITRVVSDDLPPPEGTPALSGAELRSLHERSSRLRPAA